MGTGLVVVGLGVTAWGLITGNKNEGLALGVFLLICAGLMLSGAQLPDR